MRRALMGLTVWPLVKLLGQLVWRGCVGIRRLSQSRGGVG